MPYLGGILMNNNQVSHFNNSSSGFTLIELIISLVLGLLVSAAVIQVYIISARTSVVQQSASEVQDTTIFALQAVDDHIRLANLGNPISNITSTTPHSGIVLTTNNLGNSNATDEKYLTVSADSDGWTGLSNIVGIESDQLTIQYKNITSASLYDCEGTEIASGSSDWVVERYFIRKATGGGATDLVLACSAGRVDEEGVIVTAFTGNGEIIIPAIEQFKVLLGTITDVNQLSYLPASTYLTLTEKPAITTIKLGVIVRSTTPLIEDPESELATEDKGKFVVLGTEQKLNTVSMNENYYRRSYESTITLRSARVMSVTGLKSNVTS
ncbi:PilW family protein [Psychrobacter sp. Urea-trap-16]|nr:PilW family protein [Psychrobacter sp. Urea-trap-18]MBA6287254.1 PilW family protein [Psychrobacter sp. Urea-trap-16]MBA6318368.1 PilW family protein [Psychrobacter sp. Urea-trap-20]MBA6335312.1 PilW family protein [Psychrobacter sp. Urea-trap-19]PKG60304.1 pilus assembly protein PilW [Psychrobacter sp. Choline-3u-12]